MHHLRGYLNILQFIKKNCNSTTTSAGPEILTPVFPHLPFCVFFWAEIMLVLLQSTSCTNFLNENQRWMFLSVMLHLLIPAILHQRFRKGLIDDDIQDWSGICVRSALCFQICTSSNVICKQTNLKSSSCLCALQSLHSLCPLRVYSFVWHKLG